MRTSKPTRTRKPASKTPAPRARARARSTSAPATRATARKVAVFALEKKAIDVVLLDLRKVTDVTGFFIVCTGASTAQVKAIADHMLEKCRAARLEIYHVEGYDSLRWVLVDMIDIVVHIFLPDVRAYYQLERLWGDARVERIADPDAEATG